MTDIDALVAEAREAAETLDHIEYEGTAEVVRDLIDALTTERARVVELEAFRNGYKDYIRKLQDSAEAERAKVAALEAQLEAERALSAPSREPDVWRLNKEQSQQFAEAVLAAMEEPHGKG
jgi:uncharacterized iron-regulated membrane protein